MINSY